MISLIIKTAMLNAKIVALSAKNLFSFVREYTFVFCVTIAALSIVLVPIALIVFFLIARAETTSGICHEPAGVWLFVFLLVSSVSSMLFCLDYLQKNN